MRATVEAGLSCRRLALWVIGALAVAVYGCGGPAPEHHPKISVKRGALTGNVDVTVDGQGGQDLEGEWVSALNDSGGEVDSQQIDGTGHAFFTLNEGPYSFVVQLRGVRFYSGELGHCEVPTCTTATVTIPAPIVVTVDGQGDQDLEGQTVAARDELGNDRSWIDIDENGHATFSLREGTYSFRLVVNGTTFTSGSVGHCEVPGCTTATITVPPPIVVTVTRADGSPIDPPVDVGVYDVENHGVADAFTDENGQATFSLHEAAYFFRVSTEGAYFESGEVGHCEVPECTEASITVNDVRVTVVDRAFNPLSGITVGAESAESPYINSDVTDENGQVRLGMPIADVRFTALIGSAHIHSGPQGHCSVPDCREALIVVDQVEVTVVDGDGNPIEYKDVVAENAAGGGETLGCTDDEGHVTVAVEPGLWRFATIDHDVKFVSGAPGSCEIPGDCTEATIVIHPVLVSVLDTAEDPVVGVDVQAIDDAGAPHASAATDVAGIAALWLDEGNYRFTTQIGASRFKSSEVADCHLPGCLTASITVNAPVIVTVQDSLGNPLDNQSVLAIPEAACEEETFADIDVDGHAAFTLVNGGWRFKANCGAEAFYSGSPGHCNLPGCTAATIVMVCGTCAGQTNGTACNDHNACTTSDTCQSGTCVGASPVTCTASDQCHLAGACDSATGTCSNPAKADGASCSDSDACSQTDTCQAGVCEGSNRVTCLASDQCHDPGTCNTSTGVCSDPAKADGATCTDGNACTLVDTCQTGTCTGGSSVTCAALDQCHNAGTCNTATGVCSNPAKSNGTSCNDGNACTTTDTCQTGLCTGSGAVTCVASDSCHTPGTCNTGTGTCTAEVPKANGSSCDDGNACTQTDSCQGGTCNGTNPVVCLAQDQCHAPGTCNTSTGVCSNPNKTNGTACNDGSLCTLADTCQSGTCTGTTSVTCVAFDQCHSSGTCNPATGTCSNPAKTNGSSCDDGNSCTSGETCQSGACGSGSGSCALLSMTMAMGATPRVTANLSATLATDVNSATPGDPVTFTLPVTNTGLFFENATGNTLSIQNTSGSAFTVHGYRETLEYFSISEQDWVPFAAFARNNSNATVSVSPLLTLTTFDPRIAGGTQTGVTHASGQNLYGTVIQPGSTAKWDPVIVTVLLTPAVEAVIFDPTEAAGFRAVFELDTSEVSGAPAAISVAASATPAFAGVDGRIYNLTFNVVYDAAHKGLLTPSSTDPIAPGATRTYTGVLPAPVIAPKGVSETDAMYRNRLFGYFSSGYFAIREEVLTGNTPRGGLAPTLTGKSIGTKVPIIAVTKTGPSTAQAGFTSTFGANLKNDGSGVAGPFYLEDSVGGHPVFTTVSAPSTVAVNATGSATIAYQVPLDRPSGSMTDTVAVVWQDANHNVYGPMSSSFTTTVTPASFDGEIFLSGDLGGVPDVIGTTKSMTATVVDQYGAPVGSKAVHLEITGANPASLNGTTGVDGKVIFTHAGTNRGADTAVATATIVTNPVSSNAAGINWVTADVTPCTGATTPMDIMLVIDNSGSMSGGGKLEAAKAAAKNFVDTLNLTRDQVGVITFNGATLRSRLSRNATAVKQAIDDIFIPDWFAFSDIAGALNTGVQELQGSLHNSSATRVLVLLSDGLHAPAGETAAAALTKYEQAITNLHSASVRGVSLGFGSDLDIPHLRAIASSSSDYFYAPTAEDLAWAYMLVSHDLCRNLPPLVRAGGDQGAYDLRLPATLVLEGEVHDDGPPERVTVEWTQVSGPADATIVSPNTAVTEVMFTDPGTYVFEITGSDGFMTAGDRATVTVDTEPSLSGASIGVALSAAGPLTTGGTETLTATLLDGSSAPIPNFPVEVDITGANAQSAVLITNSSGVATFTYTGKKNGVDTLSATALGASPITSSTVNVTWNLPSGTGPTLTQGWIGAPTNMATLTGQVAVTIASGVTLTGGTLTYWPASAPGSVTTLATSITGSGGATIATLDTTLLANGPYIIKLEATASGGATQTNLIAVTVAGDYKPGRVVVELTDFSIPLPGLPITIGRRYDSLEKDKIGDFGYGWSLMVGHPRLEVDAGKNVTFTMPDGRRSTFQFTPSFPAAGPVIFGFLLLPAYTPAPGVYGTLKTDGCGLLMFDPFAQNPNPICFASLFDPEHLGYSPETYTYTDPYGTVYVMGAGGELQSVTDRQNNKLTFSSTGIVSSSGELTVPFTRDGSGRITAIRTPVFDDGGGYFAHTYEYDGSGNLSAYLNPESMATRHTYDGAHRLLTTKDPRGNFPRTSTYDGSGRLASDTDAMGNVTSYAYTLATRTTARTNPDTGVVTQVFDAQGMLLSETDPLSRVTSHTYDSNRNELTMTNAAGEVTSHTYDSRGNQLTTTQTIDGTSRTTTVTYDLFGQPLTFTNPLGHVTTIAYDDTGLPKTFSDSLGTQSTFASSTSGLLLSVTDAGGKTTYFTYDEHGNLATKTDRKGRVTKHRYDGIGRKYDTTDPRGGLTQFTYYNRGPLRSSRDPLGFVHGYDYDQNNNLVLDQIGFQQYMKLFRYDALNHLSDVEYADHTHTRYTRDFRGNPLTEKDQLGRVTTYEYDHAGQLTKTTFPDSTFKTRTYDDLGRLETETDERSHTITYEYQPGCGCAERVTSITDGLGRETTHTYDAIGRKTSTTDAASHTTSYVYDVRGHVIETHYHDSTVSYDAYDTRGRHTSTTDQTGAVTTYAYDEEGQVTSVTDALSHVTNYDYDAAGNLLSVRDGRNNTTSYEYDLLNRKTKRTLPLGMSESFTYGPTPPARTHVDFRGKTTTMTYDLLDRLLARIPDPSLPDPTESYTYNATGTRATMTDASGTTSYTYDTRDRVLTKAAAAGTLTYTYDATGNVATVRSSNTNGTSVDYAWDEANQLVSVTDNRLSGVTTAAYTQTGRPYTLAQPNGVAATYAYNTVDRATSVSWKLGAGSPFASWSYAYDARGQRTSSTALSGRVAAYGYDAVSRLTSEAISSDPRGSSWNGTVTYGLDNVGNRTSRSAAAGLTSQSFSYNANDQISGDTFDANGNTTASGGVTYTYDFLDRLKAKNPGTGGAVTLTYDCDGNRAAKAVSGTTTKYLVDDLNPTGYVQVLEEVVSSAVQVRYTYGTSVVSQTRGVGGANTTSFYGYDAHGNVTFLTDGTGVVTDTYVYDAWGNWLGGTGVTVNTKMYAGEELDADIGLINLRARQYKSGSGRFLTLDPLQLPADMRETTISQSLNRYLYAAGDSVSRRDPTGQVDAIEQGYTYEVDGQVYFARVGKPPSFPRPPTNLEISRENLQTCLDAVAEEPTAYGKMIFLYACLLLFVAS